MAGTSDTAIAIRRAEKADAFALSRLYAESCRATFEGIIPSDNLTLMIARRKPAWWGRVLAKGSETLVLTMNGDVCGYVTFGASRYGDRTYGGEIYELYLLPAYQGIGLGGRLFDAARAQLRERGLEGLIAWTLADNARACEFFTHKGGQVIARSRLYYPRRTLERLAYGWPRDD